MGLTAEEKKAKKEAKKLAKLAAEVEARKQLKRDELQRDIAAQAKNKVKVDRKFRELMVKIKEPVFRHDIQVMWRSFERAYDKRDCQVTHLMKLMDVADDQFQRTVSSFCDTIDTMINKFLSDLERLSQSNNEAMTKLLNKGEEEANAIMKSHNTAETHLQLLLYTAHENADSLAWATRGENLVKEDEERTKYTNERENLRSFLENDYNNMWDNYKAVLKKYVTETADNQKKVRKLRRKQNMMADIIASQGKKIASSDGVLKRLRTELSAYESGTKQAVFRERRDRHREACYKLKQRMINGVNLDTEHLAELVKATDNTLDWLKSAHKKGEKILRMSAMCRKVETGLEKILPFGTHSFYSPEEATAHARKQQNEDPLVIKAISRTSGLSRMWQRVARAELTKRALLRERELLIHENEMMEKTLEERKDQGEPKAKKCLCKRSKSKEKVVHPIAIEGALEAIKIARFNSQYK